MENRDELVDIFSSIEIRQMVEESVNKTFKDLSENEKKEKIEMMMDIFEKGIPVQEVLGITDEKIEAFYQMAASFYNAGNYQKALKFFNVLFDLTTSVEFAMGIAECHHCLHEYEEAYKYYMFCSGMAPEDPFPFFYAYDCAMNLGCLPMAEKMLSKVIEISGDKPEYQKIKEKSKLLIDGIKSKC